MRAQGSGFDPPGLLLPGTLSGVSSLSVTLSDLTPSPALPVPYSGVTAGSSPSPLASIPLGTLSGVSSLSVTLSDPLQPPLPDQPSYSFTYQVGMYSTQSSGRQYTQYSTLVQVAVRTALYASYSSAVQVGGMYSTVHAVQVGDFILIYSTAHAAQLGGI